MGPKIYEPLNTTPPTGSAKSGDPRESDATPASDDDGVQGGGNYVAAREFNDAERKFVASGMVDAAARAAAPTSEAEQQELLAAEEEGKRRAREEDSALTKAWPDSATPRDSAKSADMKRG
jgi:hypothetical protein